MHLTPAPSLQFIQDEIYVSREGLPAQPLLKDKGFSIQISDEARCHIARTIARLLPSIVGGQKHALLEYTEKVLTVLCRDQLLRVREIVAEEVKSMQEAPHKVVVTLAKDEAVSVSTPVLEFSPVLTDDDLLAIIQSSGVPEVLAAIAGRGRLSGVVSHALALTKLPAVLEKLLNNGGADIPETSFDGVVSVAETEERLHIPLATRPDLPLRLVNRVAGFLSEAVIAMLIEHKRLSPKVQKALNKAIAERLESPSKDKATSKAHQAKQLHSQGALDAEALEAALLAGDNALVQQALAVLSGFPAATVGRILKSDNAKAITALCWKAGLSMRHCVQVQQRLGKIHHVKVLRSQTGGAYPISPAEAEVFLDIFRG